MLISIIGTNKYKIQLFKYNKDDNIFNINDLNESIVFKYTDLKNVYIPNLLVSCNKQMTNIVDFTWKKTKKYDIAYLNDLILTHKQLKRL